VDAVPDYGTRHSRILPEHNKPIQSLTITGITACRSLQKFAIRYRTNKCVTSDVDARHSTPSSSAANGLRGKMKTPTTIRKFVRFHTLESGGNSTTGVAVTQTRCGRASFLDCRANAYSRASLILPPKSTWVAGNFSRRHLEGSSESALTMCGVISTLFRRLIRTMCSRPSIHCFTRALTRRLAQNALCSSLHSRTGNELTDLQLRAPVRRLAKLLCPATRTTSAHALVSQES